MTAAQQWNRGLAQYAPAVRALARAAVAKLRKRLPGAVEFVYDNYNALVIGFGKTERPSDAILSIVLYPRHVNLGFLEGAILPDPHGLLKGEGSRFRHIRLASASTLDEPPVQALIDEAVRESGHHFTAPAGRKMIVRAVSKKRRPRRPRA